MQGYTESLVAFRTKQTSGSGVGPVGFSSSKANRGRRLQFPLAPGGPGPAGRDALEWGPLAARGNPGPGRPVRVPVAQTRPGPRATLVPTGAQLSASEAERQPPSAGRSSRERGSSGEPRCQWCVCACGIAPSRVGPHRAGPRSTSGRSP
jgi:hypothetical protein